jgi:hypothetical protein
MNPTDCIRSKEASTLIRLTPVLMSRLLYATAVLLLAGCGSAFFYRQLDWLVPAYVGQYLPMDAHQRRVLDLHVADLLAWHCGSELGPYAAWLRTLNADVQAGRLERDRLQWHTLQLEAYWRELARQASPRLADLLARSQDEQVQALLDNLREKEDGFRKDFVDAPIDEVERRLAERAEKRLRRWVGRLTDEQRQLIAAWGRELAREQAQSLAMRQRWREGVARALAHRRDAQRFPQMVQQLLLHPESTWTESQRRQFEARRERTQRLLQTLAGSLTHRQRHHFAARTGSWADDLERLSCAPSQPARQVRAPLVGSV